METISLVMNKTKTPNYRRLYSRQYLRQIRDEIIVLLGSKCLRCSFSDWRALNIDHISGGGSTLEKKLHPGNGYYSRIRKEIKDGSIRYQLLCANCNSIKRHENKEWPNLKEDSYE